jgi:class 3 adenylate cyclase/tetratricopeptide (TPR) repeat protein
MSAELTIEQWLATLGLDQYASTFRYNDIDIRALAYLDEEDLKELGVSLGHRRVLLAAITSLDPETLVPQPTTTSAARSSPDEAERRQLSILFCDIADSTELTHSLDPEEMRELLRRYHNLVGDSVRRYRGYIARFVGDGILAYFGWPQAYEDQAESAIRAGLDAAKAVATIKLNDGESLQARFGIDTGEVVVGDLIGEETSDAETVTGLSANLAARLQGVAMPGQVVIGGNTRTLVGKAFELEDLGEHSFKGFREAMQAWAVTSERESETRFETVRGIALTDLVGRKNELALLRDRWELAKGSEGQVVFLSGEAGIGKSRVVQGFWHDIHQEIRFNLHYQCSPHHNNSAFYPVIQRIQKAARFSSEDTVDSKLDKLEHLLKYLGNYDPAEASLFASLLSLPGEARFGQLDLTPQQLKQRTVETLISQIMSLSRRRPVFIAVEDVHWIDPSMAEFVAELIPRIADQPIFLLITCRPENAPDWSGHPHLTSMTLNRLGRKQAAEIAHSVGGKKLLDAIIERIVARADGVPLYIEELTKTVVEKFSSKNQTLDELVPATLQSSLVARLDRLGEAREVGQIGAVIGREFPHSLISVILGKPEAEINAALDRLVQSGLVFRSGTPPNAVYKFNHALVQDAAYATILLSRRQHLHARIVEALETQGKNQSNENIESLAHHAYLGGLWEKAFIYRQQAGRKAMDRAAIREAVAQFEQALSAATRLPETTESLQQAIDLRFDLRNALWSIAAFEDILDNLKQAENLAQKLNDQRRLGWVSVFRSAGLWQLGRTEEALAAAGNALAINQKPQDLALEIGANFYLGCAIVTSGDCRQAESYFQKIVDSLEGDLSRDRCGLPFVPAVISRSWMVWALAERGEFDYGKSLADEALEIAIEVGHPFNLAHIYYDLGYFYQVKGDMGEAVDALGKAMDYVREWSLTYLSPFIMGFLGHSYALAGRVEEGTALLQQAVSDYQSMGLGLFHSLVQMQLGEALYLGGKIEEACAMATSALTLAQNRGEQGHEAHALRLLGEIAAHPDSSDNETAMLHYESALTLAKKHGMLPLQAHCHLGLGNLYQLHQQESQARDSFKMAIGMYRKLGMASWAKKAQTAEDR